MSTFTHASASPVTVRLSVGAGRVEVVAEDRADATATLVPARSGDAVAADLIARATVRRDGARFSVTVPRPAGHGESVHVVSGRRTRVTGHGNIVIGGDLVVGGNIVGGVGNVVGVPGGDVRATVRVPTGAAVEVVTDTANVTTTGPLGDVQAETTSGDVLVDSADTLDAATVSGDIRATARRHVSATSTSGDVRITLYGSRAALRSVSGDVTAHVAADADLTASTVSGDIRVVSDPGVRVATTLRSVSGDVHTA